MAKKANTNKLGIRFDENACWHEMIFEIHEAINSTLQSAWEYWATRYPSEMDMFSEQFKVIEQSVYDAGYDRFVASLGSSNFKLFLEEFGTGSLMSSRNPWLNQYKNSEYYNSWRDRFGGAITTRPEGVYTTPNYRTGSGYLVREGKSKEPINLEKTGNPLFQPKRPTHVFLDEVLLYISVGLEERIKRVLNEFPYHEFLKVGGA